MKKIILLLISYVLSLSFFFAQEIEWQNTIGGNNLDQLYSIQQTSDGGYILGGTSTSNISGDKTENCSGGADYWIVKTDATGNIQWQNTIGGNASDDLFSVEQTSDGGYILGGMSSSDSSGDKTENNIGGSDYWLVKVSASGVIQWQNTIGGTSNDDLRSVQQTSDGGYILGGYSKSNISGDKTENCIGNWDYWIIKTDPVGNIQWQNTIGGDTIDYLESIKQTADGGYIIGGYSFSNISGDKTENNFGGSDYWIVKLNALGNIQWQNSIGGTANEELNFALQTADGGYILAGSSWSGISGDKTENSFLRDYWVIKTDPSGNIQWQNTIGGNSYDLLYSVEQTNDGGYILAGYSYSGISGDKTEMNIGQADNWIVKLSSIGNIEWDKTIGGTSSDLLYSIKQTNDGGYILAGESNSNISGDKNENCLGGGANDYWLIKVTYNFNLLTGKLFIDANSNNVQDAGEPSVINKQITEINTSRISFSKQNGDYSVSVLDSGNFSVYPASINYYNPVPVSQPAYFSGFLQTDSLNNFAFQPAGAFNDLCVQLTPLGAFRGGFNASYILNYENIGTTTLNGTVIFFPDNDVTFVSANPIATSVTTDSVVWNVGTLTPFQTGNILVTVNVTSGTPVGTLINSNVRIEPVAGDANTLCNYDSSSVYTFASLDPNAILVDLDTVLTTELSSPPYLNYIVYFQNTGNDTAFNARVLNNIPLMLDVNSFEFVASSHPENINYSAASRLFTFNFDNINLPDSGANEPASHGFIRYRIKPNATLVAGDSIRNTAFIYFDFNQPVQTDTAITEIVLPTGEEEFKVQNSMFKVFPNPVRDELIVNSNNLKEKGTIRIFDLFGREVYQLQTLNLEPETKIDVSGFSQGVYIIEMRADEKVLREKFLKE